MRPRFALLGAVVLLVFIAAALVGCASPATRPASATSADAGAASGQDQQAAEQAAAPTEGEPKLYTPAYQPNGSETAVIDTSKGEIVVELFGKDAPIHVGNFVELAEKGFYNGVRFHRYEPGFVIQGGDPQTKGLSEEQVIQAVKVGNPPLGTGGPGYVIKGEFDPKTNPNKHEEGALGMARTNNPDSAGSQFYFTLAPATFLDGQYTVFGKVTKGLDVMKSLRVGDEIVSVTIQGASK